MKCSLLLVILLLAISIVRAQTKERHDFSYISAELQQVLSDAEQVFQVRYSYVDSLIVQKRITLPQKKYTLDEFNAQIGQQCAMVIVKIDQRYYAIYEAADPLQAEVLKEILVEGFLSQGINKASNKVILSPQKIEALPGVTDADILLSLQQLPGVKSPNETASGLHIRGGTSDQNLILWDGIRMYHPGHLFGMISGFNPNVMQTVHYYNKATAPKFGERISSVIDIGTSDKIADKLNVNAGINALDADLYLRAPIIKNKFGLQVAARKSFTEWWQTPTFNALADKVFQHTNFKNFNDTNRFEFEDYSAKLNFHWSKDTQLSFTAILIDNYLNFRSESPAMAAKNQKMDIMNHGYSLNWKQKYTSRFSQKLRIYYSAYTFDYEKKQQYATNEFEVFSKLNHITDSGIELDFDFQAADKLNLEYGYQALGNDVSHSFTTKTQDFEIDLDQKHRYYISHVGYLQATYLPGQWKFQVGTRYNHFGKLQSESLEPRIFIQNKLRENLIWQATFEKKSQIMSQVRESVANDLSLENYIWILADKKEYPIQRASQFSTGLIYKTKSWLVDADWYYKTIDGVTSLAFGFLRQYDSFIRKGNGFTKGMDLLVQKSAPDWRAWVTYTYQDSQNQYNGLNNNRYFPINSAITHAFNVSFYKKWNRCSLAMGWFWHTGKPYSIVGASGQIIAFNNQELPVYHRLDISGTYLFHQQKSWSGKIGFSLFNAYNKKTVISKEYERQYLNVNDIINTRYTMQDYYSLGITPNVFFRISF